MDKITRYRSIIEKYLKERAKGSLATNPDAKAHLIIDREKDEYVFMWVGWSG